jgi:hypothetical protein
MRRGLRSYSIGLFFHRAGWALRKIVE